MMTLRMKILTLLVLLLPSATFAEEALSDTQTLDMQCREEMQLVNVVVQPGIASSQLQRCVLLKRRKERTEMRFDRRTTIRNAEQKNAIEKAIEIFGDTAATTAHLRSEITADCRKNLGISADVSVQFGPTARELRRCIDSAFAKESREQAQRDNKKAFQTRTVRFGKQIQKQVDTELTTDLQNVFLQQRKRIDSQIQPVARPTRERINTYTNSNTQSDAIKRRNADACRREPVSERAQCIHDALE